MMDIVLDSLNGHPIRVKYIVLRILLVAVVMVFNSFKEASLTTPQRLRLHTGVSRTLTP